MSTSAERQRKRRERLRKQGIVDLTVAVPKDKAAIVRRMAKTLCEGGNVSGDVFGLAQGERRLLAALQALKSVRPELEQAGIRHAGVFGSTARGEALPESDIDVLIDIDADRMGDVVNYLKTAETIRMAIRSACPDVGVDVVDSATLKSRMRENAEQEVLYAF